MADAKQDTSHIDKASELTYEERVGWIEISQHGPIEIRGDNDKNKWFDGIRNCYV